MGKFRSAFSKAHRFSSRHTTDEAAETVTKGNYMILIYFCTPVGVHGTVGASGRILDK